MKKTSLNQQDVSRQASEVKQTNLRTYAAARHLLGRPANGDVPLRLLCECGHQNCDRLVQIPFAELELVRKNHKSSYIIVPKHFIASIHTLSLRNATYAVVDFVKPS